MEPANPDPSTIANTSSNINQTQRLFLALWPDATVQAQLAAHTRSWTWRGDCLAYQPADWHVTLHFLGAVETQRVPELFARFQASCQPFDLVLDLPRLWPHGLAVLCLSEVPVALRELHDRLGQQVRELGFLVETWPYQPHITLARHAAQALPPTDFLPVTWRVRQFALVVSTGDAHQRYRLLRRYR